MVDIELLRQDVGSAAANLARRGVDRSHIDELVQLDNTWRALTKEVEQLRAQQNATNKEISVADEANRSLLITRMKEMAITLKQKETELEDVATRRQTVWGLLPNLVADGVPNGGEDDGEVVYESSVVPRDDVPMDYFTLLGDAIDLERAAKVSGSRFVYLKGALVRLEYALVAYIADTLSEELFIPVSPPLLVSEKAMGGMGYLDHEGDEIYRTQDDLYLVGTSEQSLGPMHMDEIILEESLPLRYFAFTPCFRREAGSHGKDVRGILRLHQFEKVEMFSFCHPQTSTDEHELLLRMQQKMMDELQIPYRVVKLAAGDLGSPSAITYDIESWIPSEGKYRETHSTSNTTDFQARRLRIRTKEAGKTSYVHMLNGTAMAMSRILIALIENHQQPDGSVAVPEVLHSYLPFTTIPGAE